MIETTHEANNDNVSFRYPKLSVGRRKGKRRLRREWMALHREEWRRLYPFRYQTALWIYARDKIAPEGTCLICKRRGMMLHHLSYRNGNPGPRTWQRFNEVHADPSNFVLLCKPCHAVVTKAVYDKELLTRLNDVVIQSSLSVTS